MYSLFLFFRIRSFTLKASDYSQLEHKHTGCSGRQSPGQSPNKGEIQTKYSSYAAQGPGGKFLNDGGYGWQVLQWPLEWPCSVTFHILPVRLLPGVAEAPPALSESAVRIHETNHSSASWKQHLTVVVAMGVLPCDHPQRGTREVRPNSATLSGLLGLSFDHARDDLLWKFKSW